jgi:SAM-dependent methyltransferase
MIKVPRDIKLPLYKNDGIALFIFKRTIKAAVEKVNAKIISGFYHHIENKCLCGNEEFEKDVLIAEKDMWGIAVDSVVCSKCGLIRSKTIPDKKALADFYETDYKNIYYDSIEPGEYLFNSQAERGVGFFHLVEKMNILAEIKTVFDFGCGMGGVLVPFHKIGKDVSGCDYGEEYIEYGNRKGLNLYYGELNAKNTPKNSQDLVIVSHVMEHFTDTVNSMQDIIEVVASGKYLLVEVPGLYAKSPHKYYPVWHLQKGHIFNFFYKDFLIEFFITLGLEVIYCDERCTFICRKPPTYQRKNVKMIYSDKLKLYPQRNLDYFIASYRKYDLKKWKNPVRIAKMLLKMSDMFKMRFLLSKVIKESKEWTS